MRFSQGSTTLCLTLGLLAGAAFAADPPPRFPNQQITLADWQTYLDEVRSIPDARCHNTQTRELYCVSDALKSVWVFTAPGHPAHPAVSTGVLVVYPQSAGILAGGHYAGSESAFYEWEGNSWSNDPILDKWLQAAFTHDP
jgi:hypothetical protein